VAKEKASMANNEITTILGKGSSFEGKLTFEGTVRIDGEFSGQIDTKGTLVIGQTAQVTAEINAANIVIQGRLKGEITATSSLEIHASARVEGSLSAPSLMIEKGAVFDGSCSMGNAAGRSATQTAARANKPTPAAQRNGKSASAQAAAAD